MSSDNSINLDEIIVGGLDPRTWYAFVQAQLKLLRSHVQEREKQIDESVKAYEKERVATYVEDSDDGYSNVILAEHRGIEGPPNELEDIFRYYYPNLQRRSILIVLFSFLEHQLDQLCQLFATEQRLKIIYTDLTGKGIDRTRLYLQKVIGLRLDGSHVWQEIKRIQKVRNVIVHNDAKLTGADKDLTEYVQRTTGLSQVSNSYSFRKNAGRLICQKAPQEYFGSVVVWYKTTYHYPPTSDESLISESEQKLQIPITLISASVSTDYDVRKC